MVVYNNILAGASGATGAAAGYQINRSLRFNNGDSPSLSRNVSSSNRKKWTWSGWFKVGSTSQPGRLFSAGADATNRTNIFYYPRSNNLGIGFYSNVSGTLQGQAGTTAVLADHSAWYHLVFAFDAANSTTADRIKIYINGVQQAISYTVNVADVEHNINNNVAHYVGRGADGYSFDGYLADVHFIDGQALAASDFGEYDSNNVWQPKAYSGTYGTNGFHLDFADPADLGDDNSGNGNDWTPNNLVGSAGLATANQGFDVVTYTGNGSTQSITGLNFQPDFVWLKGRSQSNVSHQLYDVVRGTSKMLQSDNNTAEGTVSGVTSFDSNGFTIGSNGGSNNNTSTYVAWAWKAGGAASSNTDGTITSSVSANTTYGFSIVSYTGTGSSASVGHGLNSAPSLWIQKVRGSTGNWNIYHSSLGANKYLQFTTSASSTASGLWGSGPSSSVMNLAGGSGINDSSASYIAYC